MLKMEDPIGSLRRGIVAVETADDGAAEYFSHDGATFRTERLPFRPFLLCRGSSDLPAESGGSLRTLAGGLPLGTLVEFPTPEAAKRAADAIAATKGACLWLRDLRQQALTAHRIRLFVGMEFSELRVLSIALESNSTGEITAIRLSDSSGAERLLDRGGEKAILADFAAAVTGFDPDALTGWRLCREILPQLEKRAAKCKVPLPLGRGGVPTERRPGRFYLADRPVSYNRFDVRGRHVVDVEHLAQLYDLAHREFDVLELPELQQHFSVTGATHSATALAIFNILAPSYFYQTRLVPFRFQETPLKGNGGRIDALLAADYLNAGHSLPLPEAPRRFTGGLNRIDRSGIFHPVHHCDVRSLYPSVLMLENSSPRSDVLQRFHHHLKTLRLCRLAAKDAARSAATPEARRDGEALQSAFKILINSFYGYLGFAQGLFNDYDLAAKVTERGREILSSMLDTLAAAGALIIEADTDGVYFQSGAEASAEELHALVQRALPAGIEVELDGSYPAMLSYKSKNYALLTADGNVKLTGAALKSRALEPFQREFIELAARDLLHGDAASVRRRHEEFRKAIAAHAFPLAALAKSETLNDSPENYRRKLAAGTGRRSAAYELALASGKEYRAGDRIFFYVTGSKAKLPIVGNCRLLAEAPAERDDNAAYYLAELDALFATLLPFITEVEQS